MALDNEYIPEFARSTGTDLYNHDIDLNTGPETRIAGIGDPAQIPGTLVANSHRPLGASPASAPNALHKFYEAIYQDTTVVKRDMNPNFNQELYNVKHAAISGDKQITEFQRTKKLEHLEHTKRISVYCGPTVNVLQPGLHPNQESLTPKQILHKLMDGLRVHLHALGGTPDEKIAKMKNEFSTKGSTYAHFTPGNYVKVMRNDLMNLHYSTKAKIEKEKLEKQAHPSPGNGSSGNNYRTEFNDFKMGLIKMITAFEPDHKPKKGRRRRGKPA